MSSNEFIRKMRSGYLNKGAAWTLASDQPSPRVTQPSGMHIFQLDLGAKLTKGQRGAVWTDVPQSWCPGDGVVSMGSEPVFDEEGFRSSLVFYDRFDFPTQNVIGYESPSWERLRKYDFVQRTTLSYEGEVGDALLRHAFDAFVALDKREPGRWTMSRSSSVLGIPENELGPEQSFGISVNRALPVFIRTVPFEEVLKFKAKRFDELLALRGHLDDLILQVSKNGTNALEHSVAFERFDRSLADHMKVMNESNAAKVMTSFKQSISWNALSTPAIELALTHTVSATGALGAVATIAIETVKGLKYKKSLSPFEYLTSVNRELY